MVKKSTQVKRKSSSKKTVPKKSSSTKKIAKGVGMAALTAGLGYAAYKGVEKYKEKKQETPKASVYDNIVSFFGFNKKAENVDMCQNELSKLKEELSNAKKNDSGVDQCKNELNKINNELQKYKEDLNEMNILSNNFENNVEIAIKDLENKLTKAKEELDDYKKYKNDIEEYVNILQNENKKLRSQYDFCKGDRVTQDTLIKVLKKQIDDLKLKK